MEGPMMWLEAIGMGLWVGIFLVLAFAYVGGWRRGNWWD